jgi:hypothetical protein
MSTLLEQAIVDAQQLRDAALKNAETTILEKYGDEVRVAVESLLEEELSPDEMFGAGMAVGAEQGMDPEVSEPAIAAAEGEELCGCPDEGEEETLVFNLNDLKAMADELEGTEAMGEPVDQEALAGEFGVEAEEEEALPLQEEVELDEEIIDEELDLDENLIKDLVEELVVDMKAQPTGWLATPEAEIKHEEELEMARRSGTEAQEELEALKDAHDRLSVTSESLVSDNKTLSDTIFALKEKLEESNLSNAKLLYMNQALNSASLNERQKSKVVESIRKADSVEEAKVIFETLQNAAGNSTSRKPKSLSEAISKPSSTLPRRRRENSKRESVAKDRFQRLAGLK